MGGSAGFDVGGGSGGGLMFPDGSLPPPEGLDVGGLADALMAFPSSAPRAPRQQVWTECEFVCPR